MSLSTPTARRVLSFEQLTYRALVSALERAYADAIGCKLTVREYEAKAKRLWNAYEARKSRAELRALSAFCGVKFNLDALPSRTREFYRENEAVS